jgi:tetratricopeptide (TPR) repeat protein
MMEQNNPAEYKEYLDKKKKAEGFHTKGYEARKKGDYDAAILNYSDALNILPNHFKALFNRGFAYDKIGKFD